MTGNEDVICPLMNKTCKGERCAFWVEDVCAVVVIAQSLGSQIGIEITN
jgi:uncharacterized membrane protein